MKLKVLITVKTYPTLSRKYSELVCTAGFREDGSWVRIYPIPYRKLDYEKRFKKYQWIELDLVPNKSDFRPETFKPANTDDIQITGNIPTDGDSWEQRRGICLKRVHYSLSHLIAEAKNPEIGTSLATFKPSKILDFTWQPEKDRSWDPKKLNQIKAKSMQGNLFEQESPYLFEIAKKLPYKFKYKFLDEQGQVSNMMIEDWEVGALFWNLVEKGEGEEEACKKVKQKFLDEFAHKKDLHFFLGTTKQYHNIAPNPFMIVGVFYPNRKTQGSLF